MKEPFDIEIGDIVYSVFPEEEETYTIFKTGAEHLKIQKDGEGSWLKLDPDTDITIFEEDDEVNRIGVAIQNHLTDEEDENALNSAGDN
jgi:hypothetical protein